VKNLFTLLILLIIHTSTFATVTWIGGAGNWANGANWSNGIGIGPGDDAVIPAPGNVAIPNGVLAVAKSVEVQAGARLRVNNTGILNIDGTIDASGLMANGLVVIYGTLNVSNVSNPSNFADAGNGIYCNGKMIIYPQANVTILSTEENGIATGTTGKYIHYGTTIIEDTDYNGISNLNIFYNHGDIDIYMNNVNPVADGIFNAKKFTNYAIGDILTHQGNSGLGNTTATSIFKNYGKLVCSSATHSGINNGQIFKNYSDATLICSFSGFAGFFNNGNFTNLGYLLAHNNPDGIFSYGNIFNSDYMATHTNTNNAYAGLPGSNLENEFLVSFREGIFLDGSNISNSNQGSLIIDGRLSLNNSTITNDWYMKCIYNAAQVFTGINSFINNGFLDDKYDKLSSHVTNIQARSHKQVGTIQNAVPFANILDIAALSTVTIGTTWYDSSVGGIPVGTFDPLTNTFLPNVDAIGLTSIYFMASNATGPYGYWVELILDNPVAAMISPFSNNPTISNENEFASFEIPNINITPYPNPTTSIINLDFNLPKVLLGLETNLLLIDQAGRIVYNQKISSDLSQQKISINIPESISSGLYHIQLNSGIDVLGQSKIQIFR